MGYIRERFGKAHTESRRASFYFGVAYGETDPCPKVYGEVDYRDLDDLIAALVDLRDNDKRYATWLKAGRRDPIEEQAEKMWGALAYGRRRDLAESTERKGLASLLKVKVRKASTFARQPWSKLWDGEKQAVACAIDNGWEA